MTEDNWFIVKLKIPLKSSLLPHNFNEYSKSGTYNSCLSRRILALASASSTERCCRLSVRFMPGEPQGDCADEVAWGRK